MALDWTSLSAVIVRAAAGDRLAQDEVAAECLAPVRERVHRELEQDFRKRHRWMLPMFSTMDVVQEVLAAVCRDLEDTSFASAGAFHAYLGTLVRHRLLDAVRFHEAGNRDVRRQVAAADAGATAGDPAGRDATPSLAASIGERADLVRQAIGELPERQRRLVELRLLEEQPFPAVAEALGYASAETARQSFLDAQARLLVKLRGRGLHGPPTRTS
jgi:RNA polymerase sigma factor (sigma-70 family)